MSAFSNYYYFIVLFMFKINNIVLSKQLNVLLIIIDDLRPALMTYGDMLAVSPNINKLAENSFVFQNAYAQQALCAPSRNSFLTSRRPDTLHLYDFYNYWRNFAGNFTTLPQYFKENNYQTVSLGKVFHPGKSSNYTDDYPMSWSEIPWHPSSEEFMNQPVCIDVKTGTLKNNLLCPLDVKLQPEETLPDIQTTLEAKKYLKQLKNSTKPFFLAVGYHKPHIPFRFPYKYLDYHPIKKFQWPAGNYVPYDLPNVAFNPYNDIRNRDDIKNKNISYPFGPIPRDTAALIRQHYYASITYIDNLLGHLMKNVDLNNTIVVLTADHGWSLGEHAEWSKYSNYEIALRVPLIIYSPTFQMRKTIKINDIVELVDLFPTLVELGSLPSIKRCNKKNSKKYNLLCTEGKSLVKLMKKYYFGNYNHIKTEQSVAYSQYPRPGQYPSLYPDSDKPKLKQINIMGYTLRTNQFRYTLWIEFNPRNFTKNWNKIIGEELYDHTLDTDENMNLGKRRELFFTKIQLRKNLKEKFLE